MKRKKEIKMKMKLVVTWCYLLFMLINHKSSNLFVSAKSLETQNFANCQHVTDFFKSFLNATIQPSSKVGECCDRCSTTVISEKNCTFSVMLAMCPVFIFGCVYLSPRQSIITIYIPTNRPAIFFCCSPVCRRLWSLLSSSPVKALRRVNTQGATHLISTINYTF